MQRSLALKRFPAFLLLILIAPLSILGGDRSPEWSRVRRSFVQEYPACAVCGSESDLEVHHIKPFHLSPDLELDPDNLITLCRSKNWGFNCHLKCGHGGNYRWENPSVAEDAEALKEIGEREGCFSDPECQEELEEYIASIRRRVKDYNCETHGICGKRHPRRIIDEAASD